MCLQAWLFTTSLQLSFTLSGFCVVTKTLVTCAISVPVRLWLDCTKTQTCPFDQFFLNYFSISYAFNTCSLSLRRDASCFMQWWPFGGFTLSDGWRIWHETGRASWPETLCSASLGFSFLSTHGVRSMTDW